MILIYTKNINYLFGFVWVILNDMYNLDIKAVCAKNARTGMMIKMLQLHRHPHSYSELVAGRHHQDSTK